MADFKMCSGHVFGESEYIPPNKILRALEKLHYMNEHMTLLGIGPLSENIIRASLELARDREFPLFFIASRNQIDIKDFGGGYVGWDQYNFVETIYQIAEQIGFEGLIYICRDHGGPWQRNGEDTLSETEAMNRAKTSLLADLLAGFNLLHIDATRDPQIKGYVPYELVIKRTLELIDYVEKERRKRKLREVGYEVGTEETQGGITDSKAFEGFLAFLIKGLNKHNLPKPDFIVGQTGTLVRMQRNVGRFNPEKAKELVEIAWKYEVGFKEHNADYLGYESLCAHPSLRITAANVAPEFGVAETKALIMLASIEEEAFKNGELSEISNFMHAFQDAALKSERWRKWLPKEEPNVTLSDIAKDRDKLIEITEVCGHYVFSEEKVKNSIRSLFENIRRLRRNPQHEILDNIKNSIAKYVIAFNLNRSTSKILAAI